MRHPNSIFSGCWKGGHCQGIAVDTKRKYVYYSFTTMLIKTDMQGRVIGSVTGLLGHLGCIDFCDEDGRVYGSLEYKLDEIGKGILRAMNSQAQLEEAFYIAIFDVDKIDRMDMDAAKDGVMTSVYLPEVLADYSAQVPMQGKTVAHRYGCSGIDGTTFGPIPGDPTGKKYLFTAYGIYDDVSRTDNDYQVILCYDTSDWKQYERPLIQTQMHRMGPQTPDHKFFAYTGNTCYGVQNLEYDEASGDYLMAVYRGHKPQFANDDMYAIDGSAAPYTGILQGVEPETRGEILTVKAKSWQFPYGSTGMCSLGDGRFYISEHGHSEDGFFSHVKLYRWDDEHPMVYEGDQA